VTRSLLPHASHCDVLCHHKPKTVNWNSRNHSQNKPLFLLR
jgi:hypothetical protein